MSVEIRLLNAIPIGLVVLLNFPAMAADPPAASPAPAGPQAPYPVFNATPLPIWTGFYVGYNLGAGWNTQKTVSNFGSPWSTTNIGFIGGLQAGYNYQISSFVVGAEIDADWMSASASSSNSGPAPVGFTRTTGQWNWTSSIGARFGFAPGPALFYGKVGYGWVTQTLAINSPVALGTTTTFVSNSNGGALFGGGIEFAFAGPWTAKLEYDYVVMSEQKFVVSLPNTVVVTPNLQMLKLGFNYRM
jgi:outer membrane immunogenic protein